MPSEDTGTISHYSWGGYDQNDQYEAGTWTGPGKWDSRLPRVAPKSCRKRPDIDFIFQLQYTWTIGVETGEFVEVFEEYGEYEEEVDY